MKILYLKWWSKNSIVIRLFEWCEVLKKFDIGPIISGYTNGVEGILLDSDRFGKVSWVIDIAASEHGQMIGQQLHWDDSQDTLKKIKIIELISEDTCWQINVCAMRWLQVLNYCFEYELTDHQASFTFIIESDHELLWVFPIFFIHLSDSGSNNNQFRLTKATEMYKLRAFF